MEYYGLIYEGILNGKPYVGQHINSPDYSLESRWKDHMKRSSGCRYFRNAIQHYGKGNVEWRIICYSKVGGQKRLDALERFFIKKRKSFTNGYNLTKGGFGGKPSDETRKLMSASQKKRYENPAERLKTSNSIRGERNGFFGRKHTQRTKSILSKKNTGKPSPFKGRKHTAKNRLLFRNRMLGNQICKGRIRTETHKKNLSIAHKNSVKCKAHIINLNNAKKGKKQTPEHIEKVASQNRKQIIQLTTDNIFIKQWGSITEASKSLSIDGSYISKVCKSNKPAKGFLWRYAENNIAV